MPEQDLPLEREEQGDGPPEEEPLSEPPEVSLTGPGSTTLGHLATFTAEVSVPELLASTSWSVQGPDGSELEPERVDGLSIGFRPLTEGDYRVSLSVEDVHQRGITVDPADMGVEGLQSLQWPVELPELRDVDSSELAVDGTLWLATADGLYHIYHEDQPGAILEESTRGQDLRLLKVGATHVWYGPVMDEDVPMIVGIPLPHVAGHQIHRIDFRLGGTMLSMDTAGGYLWVGSTEGFSWIEEATGSRRPIPVKPPDRNLAVESLMLPAGGGLWIGQDMRLCFYMLLGEPGAPPDPEYVHCEDLPDIPRGTTRITDMVQDGEGRFWLAVEGLGLVRREGRDQFERYSLPGWGLSYDTSINELVWDPEGFAWLGSEDGLLLLASGGEVAVRIDHGEAPTRVKGLLASSDRKRLWILTPHAMLWLRLP